MTNPHSLSDERFQSNLTELQKSGMKEVSRVDKGGKEKGELRNINNIDETVSCVSSMN
ncbi:hypothetical protein KIN20_034281 [Parelaphostrongylus tenuis]|uniref:Uncharacterized protein n=1 Tax=Parelaphostrongylus tenuis TaxID=148309 RepID=A0AAD5R9D1_PARTN|nr:hypothetical protein KIN20_034281 [Parelaphostrongylus tenuis]